MAEPLIGISIRGCARCWGQGHEDLDFEPLRHPVEHDGLVVGTHWSICPMTGEPILLRIGDPDERAQ